MFGAGANASRQLAFQFRANVSAKHWAVVVFSVLLPLGQAERSVSVLAQRSGRLLGGDTVLNKDCYYVRAPDSGGFFSASRLRAVQNWRRPVWGVWRCRPRIFVLGLDFVVID